MRKVGGPIRSGALGTSGDRTLVLGVASGQLVSWGALYYSFSLFVEPMIKELGWSKVEINGALSAGLLVAGLCSLPVGRWIDRYGGQALMTAGSLLGGLLFIAWSVCDSLVAFYLIWVTMGLVLAAVLYEPAFAVITRALGARYREGITAVTLIAGFASTVFFPVSHWLIESFGWRTALVALAVGSTLFCASIHFYLVGRAESSAPKGHSDATGSDGDPLRRAARTPAFWLTMICFVADSMVFSIVTFHIIPLLTERQIPIELILGTVMLFGPVGVAGRALLLFFGLGRGIVLPGLGIVALLPIALALLHFAGTHGAILTAFGVVYGLGTGLMTIVRGAIVPEFFGAQGYGAISGALMMPAKMSQAIAPLIGAMLWNWSGGYGAVLAVFGTIAFIGAAAFYLAALLVHRSNAASLVRTSHF